jgi:hypothetical protein
MGINMWLSFGGRSSAFTCLSLAIWFSGRATSPESSAHYWSWRP